MKNYYEILGISENASNNEIINTYQDLIAKYHPENFTGEARQLVENRLKDVKEAYSVLSDDFLRNQYDREIGIETNIRIDNTQNYIVEPKEETKIKKERSKKEVSNNQKIGTVDSLKELTKEVFKSLSKIERRPLNKKGVLSLLAAIAIIIVIGIILWFIPSTRGFVKSVLFIR